MSKQINHKVAGYVLAVGDQELYKSAVDPGINPEWQQALVNASEACKAYEKTAASTAGPWDSAGVGIGDFVTPSNPQDTYWATPFVGGGVSDGTDLGKFFQAPRNGPLKLEDGDRLFMASDGRLRVDPADITLKDLEGGAVIELGQAAAREDGSIGFKPSFKAVRVIPILEDGDRFDGV